MEPHIQKSGLHDIPFWALGFFFIHQYLLTPCLLTFHYLIMINPDICMLQFKGTSGFSLVQELDFISAFLSFGSSGGYCQISHKTIRVYERLPLLEHGIQLMYPTLLPMLVSLVIITVLKSTGLYCRITCNIFAPLHIRDLKLVP